ncbi:MAG: hypothetical protein ACRDSJ_03780 [Rubrobacteraceae bacterium]
MSLRFASPERGYYYHPSRHSARQPIVAGWAYQSIAQICFVRESWTAREAAEILREIAREAQRPPLGKGEAPSGDQKERLNPLTTTPSDLSRWT